MGLNGYGYGYTRNLWPIVSSASMSDIEDITADAEAELPRDDFTGVAHVRAKGKGGRQPHSVRQYFTSTSTVPGADHPDSQCNYCKSTFVNKKPCVLVTHILDCIDAPAEVKTAVQVQKASKAPTTERPTAASAKKSASSSGGSSSSSAAGTASAGSKRSGSTMRNYFAEATPFSDDQLMRLHHLLLRAMVDSGVSFRFVDSPFTRCFMDEVSGLRYTPPG